LPSEIACEPVRDAVDCRAQNRKYHPVRKYLDALSWDDRARLDNWFTDKFRHQTPKKRNLASRTAAKGDRGRCAAGRPRGFIDVHRGLQVGGTIKQIERRRAVSLQPDEDVAI